MILYLFKKFRYAYSWVINEWILRKRRHLVDSKASFGASILFDRANPFPLIENYTYQQAKVHAQSVDQWLGLNAGPIERELMEKGCRQKAAHRSEEHQELWIGLDASRLLTPYLEIRTMLSRFSLRAGHRVVDLGAGYGRMAFVMARHFPEVEFYGYEYVGERIFEAQRCLRAWKSDRIKLEHADLTHKGFCPVPADLYFIYDYGKPYAIEKTLHDLRRVAQSRPITVVGRGRLSRDIIERHHPWLSQVIKAQHFGHSSIYRSHVESL